MTDQVTYWNYLKIIDLLDLQTGLEDKDDEVSPDELHFIIVHQVFELWFKLMIRELRLARDKMVAPKVEEETIPYVVHHLKRINTILELSADHFELMETLTPQDFLDFREKLGTASGFQSFQLREIEFLMGLDEEQREEQGHNDPSKYIIETASKSQYETQILDRINQARDEPSLRDAIHKWLFRTPIYGSTPDEDGDKQVVNDFIDNYLQIIDRLNQDQIKGLVDEGQDREQIESQFAEVLNQARSFLKAEDFEGEEKWKMSRIRSAILFIESYRELPLLAWPRLLIDTIVEMEENMVSFRFDHARMVERIIGRRIGTGGSSGVDYLDETTKYRIFPELWAVRTILVPQEELPDIDDEEFYHFATKI